MIEVRTPVPPLYVCEFMMALPSLLSTKKNKMLYSNNGILIHSSNVVKFITPNLESICTCLNDFAFHQMLPHTQ
jgi:hypothetical protein